jgi:hypothetical protein
LQGTTEGGACASGTQVTDQVGNYRFSGLSAGYYNLRANLPGYNITPATQHAIVADGTSVTAGTLVGRSGNAGPCLPPHLHFEVQQVTSAAAATLTSRSFVQVDPYGWDGKSPDPPDPYEAITAMKNHNVWSYQPIIESITPQSATSGVFQLTINGQGFDSSAVDCLIPRAIDYSAPVCTRGVIFGRSDRQIIVQESVTAGTYFVHIENSDGHRSNWNKLVVH